MQNEPIQMNMKAGYALLVLLYAECPGAVAQGYDYLYQYFEADSISRAGYSEIKIKTTQTSSIKNWEHVKIETVESFYDEAGRLAEEERTSNISTSTIRTAFGYDSLSGRLNHVSRTGGPQNHEAFAHYDSLGRLAEVADCDEGKPCRMRYYEYDDAGTERLYTPAQTIEFQFGKDRPGSILGISAAGKQKEELVRERFFDPEGKLEEIRNYSKGVFSTGWLYEYDPLGRKTKIRVYKSEEKVLSNEYRYDEKGLLTEEETYVWVAGANIAPIGADQPRIIHYVYDSNNRLAGTEQYGKNYSKIQEFTYYEN